MNAHFIVNISVTADSSLLSPTGGVNAIPPDAEIHEQMTMTNGYGKVCHTSNIGETIVDNNVNDATHVVLHKLQH